MTDLPDDALHEEDLLLLDAFDGDPAAAASVAADSRLTARLAEMTTARDALRAGDIAVDPALRSDSIAAAMGVFDDMQASAAGAEQVAALATRRRPRRLFQSAGIIAASAAAVVGIVAIGPDLGDGSDDSDTNVATAAGDASDDGEESRPSSARAESGAVTTAAAQTTAVPQTTIAASLDATPSPEIATESDDLAADAADAAEPAETAEAPIEGPGVLDPRLVECAAAGAEDAPNLLDTATWLSTTPVEGLDTDPESQRWLVQLDSGFELDLLYAPETCEFFEIGDQRGVENDDG